MIDNLALKFGLQVGFRCTGQNTAFYVDVILSAKIHKWPNKGYIRKERNSVGVWQM